MTYLLILMPPLFLFDYSGMQLFWCRVVMTLHLSLHGSETTRKGLKCWQTFQQLTVIFQHINDI